MRPDRQTLVLSIEHCLREGDDRGARGSLERLAPVLMTAAVAAAWFPNLKAAAAMARAERCFDPDPGLADLYAERFDRFTAAYRRLRSLYAGSRI